MKKIYDIREFVPTITEQSVVADLVKRTKQRRKELHLTQNNLAAKSGVSLGSVRRFESSGEISLSSLVKIAHAIDCLADFNLLFAARKITNLKDFEG